MISFSRGINCHPHFSTLLDGYGKISVGWGRKRSGARACSYADKQGVPWLLLEDGFLRSVAREEPSLSLVVDDLGIYYDANVPSRLENLISKAVQQSHILRVCALLTVWRKYCLSKINEAREFEGVLSNAYVLVIDQVRDDFSIKYGLADVQSFEVMLKAAISENPAKEIIVKLHPDVYTRAAASHFDPKKLEKMDRVRVIAENCHPVRLIKNADAVYTVTSQVGFEALIWGKRVRTFGMPFYAGWGLTEDELPAPPDRRGKATLEQLVYSALVAYPRYINPVTDQRCEVEQAIEHIARQRQKRLAFPRSMTAIGFSRWKKPFVGGFLQGSEITFSRNLKTEVLNSDKAIAVWGGKHHVALSNRDNVLRLEDGFLRSSGLGADLVRPLSLIVDDIGIYYDATRPSRLENILNQQQLSDAQLERAKNLRLKIVDLQLTKYNVGTGSWHRPDAAWKVILVVGQVESDASIEFGSPEIKSNLELLKRVRDANPDAYIVYKPHPDVIARLRRKGQQEDQAGAFCDEIIGNVATDALFEQIDELHTSTSLIGFEALMRGVAVICHGMPFYAGWGLTTDKLTCERRSRVLTLDELVYGALITYPRYMHAEKAVFIEPETAVDQLARMTEAGVQTRNGYRKLIRLGAISWATIKKA